MPSLKRSPLLAVALGLAICFAAYRLITYLCVLALMTHYESYIPPTFEIDRGVFAGEQVGGFAEGCRVAVFSISGRTATDISAGGVVFLNETARATRHKDRQYQNWREAPVERTLFQRLAEPDAGGNVCAEVPDVLIKDILAASRGSGAFHSGFNPNTEIVVIPSLRLVVFSHDR